MTKVGKYAQQYGPEIAADYANIKWAEILRDGRRLLVIMQWGRGGAGGEEETEEVVPIGLSAFARAVCRVLAKTERKRAQRLVSRQGDGCC